MNRFRRSAIALIGLSAVALSALMAAPAAFAMRVAPSDDVTTSVRATGTASGGLATWELALICTGVAVFVAVGTLLLARARSHSRLQPAAH
jgi:hypothetical protein